jgi:predicted nucleic acid-binding protein
VIVTGKDLPGARRLRQLEVDRTPFSLPVICCQEVLQGARDQREWALLFDYLGSQNLLHNDEDYERIREVRPLKTLRS